LDKVFHWWQKEGGVLAEKIFLGNREKQFEKFLRLLAGSKIAQNGVEKKRITF